MVDIWSSVNRGMQFGDTLRERQQEREYGDAFAQGGVGAVEQAAGRRGDMEGVEGARMMARKERMFEDDQTNAAFGRLQSFGGFATSALRRAQGLPPEQRAGFLNAPHIRQRFEAFGFQPQQIDNAIANMSNPETAEATFQNLFAAFGGQGLDWSVLNTQTGEIGAIDPVSGQTVMSGGRVPAGYGQAWRPATAEEMASWGFRPGTTVDVNVETGERRVRQAPAASGRSAQPGAYEDDGYDYEGG